VGDSANRILLVEGNADTRNLRAILLSTHGYGVDAIASLADLDDAWQAAHYRLVLLSTIGGVRNDMGSWKRIQHDHPAQGFMLLLDVSERLCPLFFDGVLVRDEEMSDAFLPRIEAALIAARQP